MLLKLKPPLTFSFRFTESWISMQFGSSLSRGIWGDLVHLWFFRAETLE
jgi:hypothetical protein